MKDALDSRKLATVLAALRHWQETGMPETMTIAGHPLWDVATDGGTLLPLSAKEIDDLCEELNLQNPEPCYCQKAHPWGIGTTVTKDGAVILWDLVAFHSEGAARAYRDKLNREKVRGRANYFVVNMCPRKDQVTS